MKSLIYLSVFSLFFNIFFMKEKEKNLNEKQKNKKCSI